MIPMLNKIKYFRRIARKIGLIECLRYYLTPRSGQYRLKYNGFEIWVRRSATDLRCALYTFDGEFDIFQHLNTGLPPGIILDAGGYIGTAALALSKLFPDRKIVCIEPSPDNFSILEENVQNLPNIKLIHAALTSEERETIKLHDRQTGEWGLTIVASPDNDEKARTVAEVPTITLAQIIEQFGPIALAKIDIEGAEKSLMQHASELAAVQVISIELHERIVRGCEKAFYEFSRNRLVLKDTGEKYISIKY